MSNSLSSDFQAFTDNRLDCAGSQIKDSPDYKRENENISQATREVKAVLPPEKAITLNDIEDSYLAIISLCERICYKQGFRDAIRLMAGA